ncbi:MAG: FCD domain-containing protein [Peptococcaceae bacterium]|nr:FCD domain-containing protein [Peptococcaceae bacterium]
MPTELDEKEILILELIRSAPEPIGSWYIVNYLNEKGIRVSSATVGRVLNKLESRGYLQKEKFKGRIITEKGYQAIRYNLGLREMASEQNKIVELIDKKYLSNLLDILGARLVLEPGIAACAAENADEKDLIRLKESLLAAEANRRPGQWVADDNLDFHVAVAAAAKNPILASFFKQLSILMMQTKDFQYIIRINDEDELKGHRGVYDAIINKEPEKARQAMENHIRNLIRDAQAAQ